MKVKIRKNGSISMTAQSDKDSLGLLKLLHKMGGSKNDSIKELIEKKERQTKEHTI